jgi:hypothetical protein
LGQFPRVLPRVAGVVAFSKQIWANNAISMISWSDIIICFRLSGAWGSTTSEAKLNHIPTSSANGTCLVSSVVERWTLKPDGGNPVCYIWHPTKNPQLSFFSFHYLSAPVIDLLFICESMGLKIETPH